MSQFLNVLGGGAKSGGSILAAVGTSIGLRNRLINGDMRIDQANAGAVVTVNAAATFRSLDKWSFFGTGSAGVITAQQASATPPSGFVNYLRMTTTTADAAPAAGSAYSLQQNVEGTYCEDLQFGIAANGKNIAVSFQARSSLTGTFSGSIRNSGNTRSYPFTFSIGTAATWTPVSVSIPTDTTGTWLTTTGVGLSLGFDLGSGSTLKGTAGAWTAGNIVGVTGAVGLVATNGATLDITGAQLEPGTASTAYEQVAFPDMIQRCQREYSKSFILATAPVQNAGVNTGNESFAAQFTAALGDFFRFSFPQIMRAAPTVTLFNPAAANAQVRDETAAADCSASTATTNVNERGVQVATTGNVSTAIGNKLSFHWTADARL